MSRINQYRGVALAIAFLIGGALPQGFTEEALAAPAIEGFVAYSEYTTPPLPIATIYEDGWDIPLMDDPLGIQPPEPSTIEGEIRQIVTTTQTALAPINATINSNRTLTRIAVVPHDYRGTMGETAFDPRLGDASCSMKGAYARCVYKKDLD